MGTLRRLELHEFHICMDRVGMMLQYFLKLETCHIMHILPFVADYDEYDDEEPPLRRISGCAIYIVDDRGVDRPSGWFDAAERAKFEEAMHLTFFRLYTPSLLKNFNSRITRFLLPLWQLSAHNVRVDGRQFLADNYTNSPSITCLIHNSRDIPLAQILSFFLHPVLSIGFQKYLF